MYNLTRQNLYRLSGTVFYSSFIGSMANIVQKALRIKSYLKTVFDFARSISLMIIEWPFTASHNEKKERIKKRVVVIKLDAIGDFILWLDSAKNLRSLYPEKDYAITLVGNKVWISLAKDLPYFDEVLGVDRKKFIRNIFYRLKILTKIRNARFNEAIQPTFSRELLFGDSIVRWSGATLRIGSEGDYSNIRPWQKRISDRWYTRLIPARREQLMELVRNAEFMRGLGLSDVQAYAPKLPLLSMTKSLYGDYVILFPGASMPIKQWPLDNFLQIARKLHHSTSLQILLCGGVEDSSLGTKMEALLEFPIVNRVGKTSLSELASLVAGAMLLVGNDTSAIHIASSVSTPSICIAGGGHFGRFVPYYVENGSTDTLPVVVTRKKDCFGCNWRCIYPLSKYKPAPCISDVSVNEVWNEVMDMVNKIQTMRK